MVSENTPKKLNPILLLFLIFPIAGIVVAISIIGSNKPQPLQPPTNNDVPFTLVGQPAPDFQLSSLSGQAVNLSSSHGKWTFVNFWATWCIPCKEEMPTFQKLLNGGFGNYGNQVTVLAVDYGEDAGTVSDYLQQRNLHVPVVLDPDFAVSHQYGIIELPVTYVVDPSGVVRYKQFGEMTAQRLQEYLDVVAASTDF